MQTVDFLMAFLPELLLLAGALALFVVSLGHDAALLARRVAAGVALVVIAGSVASLGR